MLNDLCDADIFNRPLAEQNIHASLNQLTAFDAAKTARRRLFRNAREEQEMLLMRRPVSTSDAYALLGTLLGVLPPAAIFYRIFFAYRIIDTSTLGLLAICFVMNVICCLTGRVMGAHFGERIDDLERSSWNYTFVLSFALGCLWGLVCGSAGGVIFVGIGAFFGVFCAVPIGATAFSLFTLLHRLLARGGMIEAGLLWPLACGIALFIVALILSPHIFPY